MAKTIHEQTGLRIWRNERNGFTVARLHFTADSRKRSPEWIAASQQGLSKAKWEQEFDINYTSQQGEKAFPEILAKRELIVHKEGPYLDNQWPSSLVMWGGFDYGARNPSSFHVYTVVDGVTWCIWELYQPCRNIIDFARALKECPFWNQIRYIVHDPDMGNLKARDMTTGNTQTVLSQFESLGIRKWIAGRNDEATWLSTMQRHWCGLEITFKILETCPMMIDEFEQATYRSITDRQLETQDYNEGLVDKHNHSLDDCKYFMNSAMATRGPVRPLKIPSLATSYGWPGSGDGAQRGPGIRWSEVLGARS